MSAGGASGKMIENRIRVVSDDITTLQVDAIVNAANDLLMPGGGVCGAIHRAAGTELAEACELVRPCPTGEARLTPGFRLPAPWVIHTVGPVWCGGGQQEAQLLAACYRNSLRLAADNGIERIAFPAISCGIFGYPAADACRIAVAEIRRWLAEHAVPKEVVLVAFDPQVRAAYENELKD